jgi:DNA polymerase-3 subunit epsilon
LILQRAVVETGLSPEEWRTRATQPIDSDLNSEHHGLHRDGSLGGELSGEILVFTGSLSIPRREAADAAAAGCQVDDGVNKHTTMLVVGDQDLRRLAGKDKSSKHLKAEGLIGKGQSIRILGESDFMRVVSHTSSLVGA